MHNTGYKSALARRACRYSDARPPRKTDGVLLESELPPRMRGKGVAGGIPLVVAGITPTYAGKRSGRSGPIAYSQDHPRICGEKQRTLAIQDELQGSPPRMRGKANPSSHRFCSQGITPAYAGKSSEHMRKSGTNGDHPRICGEKCSSKLFVNIEPGSPPRMRGKGVGAAHFARDHGIIPAYAGKS